MNIFLCESEQIKREISFYKYIKKRIFFYHMEFVYRPLLIETLTYKYKSTQEEKDFTIKKKVDGFIDPITIKEVPQYRPRFAIKPNTRQMLRIQQSKPQSYNPEKVRELIQNDKQLLKRKKKKSFDETMSDTQTKSQYRKQLTEDVSRMLGTGKEFPHPIRISKTPGQQQRRQFSNQQRAKTPSDHNYNYDDSPKQQQFNGVFRKVSSPKVITQEREQFSDRWKNLPKMYDQLFGQKPSDYESQDSQESTSKQIQFSIQIYLKKRDEKLANVTKITSDASLMRNSIKMSIHSQQMEQEKQQKTEVNDQFVSDLLGVYIKQRDPQLSDKQDEYWQEDKKGRTQYQMDLKKKSKYKHKKLAQMFSEQVGYKFAKMKKILTECIRRMRFMRVTPDDLIAQRIILKNPYQREGSYIFLKAVQKNDIELAQLMLNKCRYYAFDVNENFQTGLHLCARRGWYDMADMLLRNGAYPDEVDICKRTPLYYAIQYNQIDLVGLLLYYQASPWSFDDCKYETKNVAIYRFLKMSRKLEILKFMTPYRDRDTLWNQFKGQFLS
ncbi:hypothetical protein pb186bvf_007923 [Paramecium bursaria]